MKIDRYKIKVTFVEPVLGMTSGNKEIQTKFISDKAKNDAKIAEEVAAIPDVEEELEKTSTVFPKDETGLFWWDYQIRGFFKEQIGAMIELGEPAVKALSKWSYKRAVDQYLLVSPRRAYLHREGGEVVTAHDSMTERPLRCTTMRGDRIALASSQTLNPGVWFEFEVSTLTGTNPKTKLCVLGESSVRGSLIFGSMHGFGQWRTGGYGRFTWEGGEAVEEELKLQ